MGRVMRWTIWEAGLSSAFLRSFVVILALTFLLQNTPSLRLANSKENGQRW